jgi:hypothetical protein
MNDEQTLIESVLQGKESDIRNTIMKSPENEGLVRDIEEIKKGLLAIEDEEPPFLGDMMLKKQKSSFFNDWLSILPTNWYFNPFVLCMALVAFLWFLYIFIVFLLK